MTDNKNEIIKCPFCFKESERGIKVCRGCQATVKYGESLMPYFIISLIISVIGAYFTLRFLGEHIFTSIQNLSGSAGFSLFGILAFILFILSMYICLFMSEALMQEKK